MKPLSENIDCLKNKTVLIVDDYPINLELMKIFVEETGALPLCATNGADCLEMIKKNKVDLILMDLNMPQMNGLETTKAIRAIPQFEDIVIIGVTGYENKEEIDSCREAGMNDAVPKFSFNPDILIELASIFFCKNPHIPDPLNVSVMPNDKMNMQSVIDFKKALRDFEGDSELLLSLTEKFVLTLQSQLDVIESSFRNNDPKKIELEAHKIKGGAANLYAYQLAEAARELEISCRTSQSPDAILNKLSVLQEQVDLFPSLVQCKAKHPVS